MANIIRRPGSENNLLHPEYGTNFRYIGRIKNNLDRVQIVASVPIPTYASIQTKDLNFTKCNEDLFRHMDHLDQNENNLRSIAMNWCARATPFVQHKRQESEALQSRLKTLLTDELYAALPELKPHVDKQTLRTREKRGLGALLFSALPGLITLAVETVSSFFKVKQEKRINTAVTELRNDNVDRDNKLQQYQNDFLMYGRYNLESISEIIDVVNNLHHTQTQLELMFKQSYQQSFLDFVGLINFQFNLQMFLQEVDSEHVTPLQLLEKASSTILRGITELYKGYLPRELISDTRLRSILHEVRHMVRKKFPDYDLANAHISHYRDMKLVTFLVDRETHALIISFPIFIQNYKRKAPLPLYEIESTYVPVPDKNKEADSYTKVRIDKPYFAGNKDYYIQLRISELMMCKSIRYTYYCEEIFVVKHKNKHTCPSAIFYKSKPDIISSACAFDFYYNKTVTPVLLDGGDKILLANFLGPRTLQCAKDNSGLAQSIPQHAYVVIDREFLCGCQLDLENYSVLRQLSSCNNNSTADLKLEFCINLAFYEALGTHFPNSTDNIRLNLKGRLQYFDVKLQHVSKNALPSKPMQLASLLDKMNKNYEKNITIKPNIKPPVPLSNYMNKVLTVISALTSIILFLLILYLLIKHFKLKFMVSSLVLATTPTPIEAGHSTPRVICTDPTLTTFATVITICGVVFWLYTHCKDLSWIKGYEYTRTCTLYVFLFNNHRYIPLKIRHLAGHMHMYHLSDSLNPEQIAYTNNCIWDTLHFDWSYVTLRMNATSISLPTEIQIPLKDKLRVRRMLQKEDLDLQFMIKQGSNWYSLNRAASVLPN